MIGNGYLLEKLDALMSRGRPTEIETPVPRGAAANGAGVLRANGGGGYSRHPTTIRGATCSRLCGNRVNPHEAARVCDSIGGRAYARPRGNGHAGATEQ
jgi:hypothetical protein